jgi:hypothetical protein
MKVTITLKIESSLLRAVRLLAAEESTSVSAILEAQLQQIVREHNRESHDRSLRRALARLGEGMDLGWTRTARDDLYDR